MPADVLFVRDSEIRCTLPGEQYAGLTPITVSTWNPAVPNATDPRNWQTSSPVYVLLSCPEDFYGRANEVRRLGPGGGGGGVCLRGMWASPPSELLGRKERAWQGLQAPFTW